MHDTHPSTGWHWMTRIAFRLLFVYFLLAFASALCGLVPLGEVVGGWIDLARQPLYVWIGRVVFGVDITVFPNGSGDTTFNWVQLASELALAFGVALVWTALDRTRVSYPRLHDGLWIAMRFVLASAMFSYGLAKVFEMQFPAPDVSHLLKRYGEASPMGLLWTFMGASRAYSMFAGWMEIVGGVLLCFRRTQLAGALFTAGVMVNVFMLNMCYDVPVKIFSFQLLAIALVIAAPDLPRLVRMFLLNRPVPRADLRGPWTNRTLRRVAFAVKCVWLVVVLGAMLLQTHSMQRMYISRENRGWLDGFWKIREFRRDGELVPGPGPDALRWEWLGFVDMPEMKSLGVIEVGGGKRGWRMEVKDNLLTLFGAPSAAQGASAEPAAPPPSVGTLEFAGEGERGLRVSGTIEGVRVEAICERREPGDFLLMNRGFRWINEEPFNR
ncbi:MAG: hypothetical protein FJ292_06780 [Planctomycetes bacterium]|nr:hypothetical protein [Planctomycetota bacterium]